MRDLLYSALCALMITAATCGGGGPPGGGNGDTDGGDTTVNLIEAIPGQWRIVRVAGQLPPDEWPTEGDVRVDADDPDCEKRVAEMRRILDLRSEGDTTGGPPGDACIVSDFLAGGAIILDSASIRFDAQLPDARDDMLHRRHYEGVVIDNGMRMEYWEYSHIFNPPDRALFEIEKVR